MEELNNTLSRDVISVLTYILESQVALRLLRKELPSQTEPLTYRASNVQEGKPNPVEALGDARLDGAKPCQSIRTEVSSQKLVRRSINRIVLACTVASKTQVVKHLSLSV